MSVSRRLSLLVVSELCTAVVVVIAAVMALGRLSEQQRYMRSYVFAPLVDLQSALVASDELRATTEKPISTPRAQALVRRLRTLVDRYQQQWQVGDSSRPEAARFRAILEHAGRASLIDEEYDAANDFLASVKALEHESELGDERARPPVDSAELVRLNTAILRLNDLNIRYMRIGHEDFADRFKSIALLYLTVGIASIIAAPLFGLAVRNAIAPRVALLVEKIQRFRDCGVNEPIDDEGGDELTQLGRVLDVSFAAIAARDKEREQFLAIAAHELKTPLTTMKGFAQAALAHRNESAVRDRALAVIDRQASRLARLIQDLLLSARAQAGTLSFQPAPLDLEASARRVIAEVELLAEGRSFPVEVRGDTHLLGDAWLIEQSLSSLLIQAMTTSPRSELPVTLDATPGCVRFTVEARDVDILPDAVDKLTEPFAALQFEGRTRDGPRSTGLGLHLAREIARLHAGTLSLERRGGSNSVFFVLSYAR